MPRAESATTKYPFPLLFVLALLFCHIFSFFFPSGLGERKRREKKGQSVVIATHTCMMAYTRRGSSRCWSSALRPVFWPAFRPIGTWSPPTMLARPPHGIRSESYMLRVAFAPPHVPHVHVVLALRFSRIITAESSPSVVKKKRPGCARQAGRQALHTPFVQLSGCVTCATGWAVYSYIAMFLKRCARKTPDA